MIRFPLSLLNLFLRLVEKPFLRRATDPAKLRRRLSRQARWIFADPTFANYQPDNLSYKGRVVRAEWASKGPPEPRAVILYFHGGAYVMGGPDTHRAMLARLSSLTGIRAVLPDYGLAPENAFPEAIMDALASYQCLLERGYPPEHIVLGGDSAGGGLVLALLHDICTKELPQPRAVFAFSPLTDLTMSGESVKTLATRDSLLPADRAFEMGEKYLQGADPKDPRASPLFGKFKGAPPVLIQASDSEILLDDARRMVGVLKKQGVSAELSIWKSVPHVWQIFQGRLKQADLALSEVAEFLRTVD